MNSKLGMKMNLLQAGVVGVVFLLSVGSATVALAQQRGGRAGSQGRPSFSGRSFSGGAARGSSRTPSFSGTRSFSRVQPFTRGPVIIPRRVEPRFRSVPSFGFYGYYSPYSYSFSYPYPSCGFYDQWAYWHADPYCSSYPYYPYSYPY